MVPWQRRSLTPGEPSNWPSDSTESAPHPNWKRVLSATQLQLADVLLLRGRPGDADQALKYYTRSLEILESLLKANPGSAQAARDVSISLGRLGDFLATRGRPGDADQALKYFTRSLELAESLLKANHDSAQAARDVSVSLNHLGAFLAARPAEGCRAALKHFTRSLEIRELLLKANHDSAQAARDFSVSLE